MTIIDANQTLNSACGGNVLDGLAHELHRAGCFTPAPLAYALRIGWITALVGTRIQSVAVGWEIYQRTGQALALGFVGLIMFTVGRALSRAPLLARNHPFFKESIIHHT